MRCTIHLTPADAAWPTEFEGLQPAPRELWLRGRRELLARRPRVAVVGTRSPTPYGQSQAERFARAFARAGVLVVSGLARGIDEIAHRAALEGGGETLAVLGCGVDRPWPSGALSDRLATEGLLISEYEPGTPPARHHFPLRNRLIAALSGAVVVIEAAFRSGSLITAHWGSEQGRAVFALPGRVDQPMARGCHRLIAEGAALLEEPAQVLEALGIEAGRAPEAASRMPLDARRERLLAGLLGETLRAEELAERTGTGLSECLALLSELELDGRVVRAPGGLYRLPA
jgi:DNA processing protein